MKKRGSALIYVIAFSAILLMVGTVVSSAVIATTKYNQEHSNIIDLELAAKSGLNIFVQALIKDINDSSSMDLLPEGSIKTNSGITEFDGIEIYKEIIKENIEESGSIKGYKYTVISSANQIGKSATKSISQVVNVNIDEGSGEIGDIIISPENILNIKGNIKWDWSDLSFLNKVAYGGELIANNHDKNSIEEYIKNNKLGSSGTLGNLNVNLNESGIDSELKIPFQSKKVEEVNGLSNIKWSNINKENIKDKRYYVDEVVRYHEVINIDNSTLVIDNNFISEHSLTINMMNNSKLIINGYLDVSQDITIKLDNTSFIEVNGNVIVNNGRGEIVLKSGSVFNVLGSITAKSNPMNITLDDNSIIDVNEKIEGNTVDINLNKSKLICRNDGIYSKSNPINIKAIGSSLSINGIIIGNGINLKLSDGSIINTKGVNGNGNGMHYININLDNSNALFEGEIKGNIIDADIFEGVMINRGKYEVNYLLKYKLVNSIVIIEGELIGHTFEANLTNSIGYILNKSNTYNSIDLIDVIKINNINNSTFYVLGNLETSRIEVIGDSKNVTPSDVILNKAKILLGI